jgi:phosphoglycolate phosphatase
LPSDPAEMPLFASAPDAAVFDFDGVIIDSREAVRIAVNAALVEHGFSPRAPRALDRFIGPPVLAAFAALTGEPEDSGVVANCAEAYHRHYASVYLEKTALVAGIAEALAKLTLPLALATAKQIEFVRPLLEKLGISGYFPVLAAPTMSELHEPKAVLVERALSALGAGDAVIVGDTRFDIEAAHANGARAIGVTWGIGDRAELRAAGADAILREPAELPMLLDGR